MIGRMSCARKEGCLGRIVSAIVGLAVAIAAVFALTNAAVVLTTRDRIVPAEEAVSFDADAIVVLGASVYADGTPSGVLRDRLDDGIALYFAGAAPKIVMSGDGGGPSPIAAAKSADAASAAEEKGGYDEVSVMCDYAIAQGVPASALVRNDTGYSTYESMHDMRDIFGYDRIVIATQTYHLYRAIYVAQGLGMNAIGVASDYHEYENQARFDVREIPARTKDFFQTLFQVPASSAAAVGTLVDRLEESPSSRA